MPTCMHVVLFQPGRPPNTGNVADCAPSMQVRCISSSLWASSLRTVTSNGRASTIAPCGYGWYGPTSTPTSGTPGRAGGSSSPAPGGAPPCTVSSSRKTIPSFSGAKPQGCRRSDRALAASCPHPHQRRSPQHQPFHRRRASYCFRRLFPPGWLGSRSKRYLGREGKTL